MSGILGIWNQDGRPVNRAELSHLSATLAHRGPDGEGFWVQGSVGLGCQLNRITPEALNESQPLVHPSGSVLVFDGRLDNREELLARLNPSPRVSIDSPDTTMILEAYMEYGDQFPKMLTGDFALALYDPKRKRLLLSRDALGVRPLYYTQTPGAFLFASEIKALLAHSNVSPHPNDVFLGNLLSHNLQENEELTCFEGVKAVPPAYTILLTPQGLKKQRCWDFDVTESNGPHSFSDAVEGFHFHFEQAVKRRLRSAHPVAVSLSGGLDSSSIYCLAESLRQQGSLPAPHSFGISYTSSDKSPSDEKEFLGAIEQQYGTTIERVPLTPLGWNDYPNNAALQSETPLFSNQWNPMRSFLRETHNRGARVLLTGHWGDQMLFPTGYLIDLFRHFKWTKIRTHLHEYNQWLSDVAPRTIRRNFFFGLLKSHLPNGIGQYLRNIRATQRRPWYPSNFIRHARQHISDGFTRPRNFGSAHIQNLYEEARSGYYVHSLEWNNKVAAREETEMAFPFLDRDLITFLMTIPGDFQTHQGIPKTILREAMHDVLPEPIRQRTWKASFTHLINEGIQQDLPRLTQYLKLNPMAIERGYLQKNFIQTWFPKILNRMSNSSCEAAWQFSDVLGLELWLRAFYRDSQKDEVEFSEDKFSLKNMHTPHEIVT